jgi:ASC-1-like (ASCH) protein
MNWNITLNSPWFEHVKNGSKIYEGRCNWKQASQYKVGDFLNVKHHTDSSKQEYIVKIVNIYKFDTFKTALSELTLSEVLPGIQTIEEGVNIYLRYYKLTTQLENGILMLELNL